MKYIFLFFFLFVSYIPTSWWMEDCYTKSQSRLHFYVEVQSNVNARNLPCTTDSQILRVAQAGEKLHVVWQTDDFYEVSDSYSNHYWVWKWAVETTDWWLTINDKKRASEFVVVLEKLLKKQNKQIDTSFINNIKKLVNSSHISQKEKLLFDEIFYILDKKNIDNISQVPDDIPEDHNQDTHQNNTQTSKSDLNEFRVDKQKALNYWLDLNNTERSSRGLYDYVFHESLNTSAQNWSEYQKSISFATHKRDSDDEYYDYHKINTWLKNNGVVCENRDKFTHTENVAWWWYVCREDDCTEELQTAMTRTFDFYMSEEPDNWPHFRSIVNDYFTQIWVGISIEETQQNYFEFYSTVHYCTQVK